MLSDNNWHIGKLFHRRKLTLRQLIQPKIFNEMKLIAVTVDSLIVKVKKQKDDEEKEAIEDENFDNNKD